MKYKFYIDRQVKVWHREHHEIKAKSYDEACEIARKLSLTWDSDSSATLQSQEYLEQTADFGYALGMEVGYTNKIEVICNNSGNIIFEK